MTEAEWLAATHPEAMRAAVGGLGLATRRKRRVGRAGAETSYLGRPIDLLRELYGNPFRPVTLTPDWLTSTVVALAQRMYDTLDYSLMPILADALQDAGCEQPDILAHCRGDGPHARGCWVVDLVLGKT